jgi:hypothetical protein
MPLRQRLTSRRVGFSLHPFFKGKTSEGENSHFPLNPRPPVGDRDVRGNEEGEGGDGMRERN